MICTDCDGALLPINGGHREGYDIEQNAAQLVASVKAAALAVETAKVSAQ